MGKYGNIFTDRFAFCILFSVFLMTTQCDRAWTFPSPHSFSCSHLLISTKTAEATIFDIFEHAYKYFYKISSNS